MKRIEDIVPTKGNLILEPIQPDAPGQLALPDTYKDPNPRGRIVAVYEGCDLEVGHVAYFFLGGTSMQPIKIQGKEYVFVDEDDILGTAKEARPEEN